ncbi:hypothetical protein KJ644_00060 [Candidatus Dependentiae bacterium]|nr:hypothetical protein [Candidatus Dependentiae bacterium]MBU4386852.1 hypothetical protein [Candidatus Dependentiae bacterium]MCG2756322.1 hypothetical protein [Candidatus Dependentiae bacterium]
MINKKFIFTITLISSVILNILSADQNTIKEFENSDFKVTIEYNPKDFNNQTPIMEAIKKLAAQIPSQEAAKKYFENLKSIFEIAKKHSYFNKTNTKKSSDELIDEATWFALDINAKEKTIEQSIYLSTFPKQLIAALTNVYLIDLTKYIENMDDYEENIMYNSEEKSKEELEKINIKLQNAIKDITKNFFDIHLENVKIILNTYFTL